MATKKPDVWLGFGRICVNLELSQTEVLLVCAAQLTCWKLARWNHPSVSIVLNYLTLIKTKVRRVFISSHERFIPAPCQCAFCKNTMWTWALTLPNTQTLISVRKTLALMTLHLQARLARPHNTIFTLPNMFGVGKREIISAWTPFEVIARNRICCLRQAYFKFQCSRGFDY